MLTGATNKGRDHAVGVKELKQALARQPEAVAAERALRELVSVKADAEYGAALRTRAKTESLVRRARTLVDLAAEIVRLSR